MDVFMLWHTHELAVGAETHEEAKLIGVFSSESRASEAVEQIKDKEGFRDFPLDCFELHKMEVDRLNWADGFFTVYWAD